MDEVYRPMAQHERPVSGGFYVVRDRNGSVAVVLVPQLVMTPYTTEFQYVLFPGSSDHVPWDELEFIARIYPDRMANSSTS
jgi:hypothetical protein